MTARILPAPARTSPELCDPDDRRGLFPLEARYTLEPAEGGTRLTLVIEGAPGGFFKLAEPLVVSMSKRSYESDLHNLKEMLEAQAA